AAAPLDDSTARRSGSPAEPGSGRGRYHTGGKLHGLPGRYRLGPLNWDRPYTSNAKTAMIKAGIPTKTNTVSTMLMCAPALSCRLAPRSGNHRPVPDTVANPDKCLDADTQ